MSVFCGPWVRRPWNEVTALPFDVDQADRIAALRAVLHPFNNLCKPLYQRVSLQISPFHPAGCTDIAGGNGRVWSRFRQRGQEINDDIVKALDDAFHHGDYRVGGDRNPRFLPDLPLTGRDQRFAGFLFAPRDRPQALGRRFVALDEQDSVLLIDDDGADTNRGFGCSGARV